MREWLPEGHLAFFVTDVVDELDTTALHGGHHHDAGGRPGYDPEMLLALLVYAYCTGVRSSRQMERLCEVDIGYRVICANRRPDHSTIARFRQAQDGLVQDLFVQALALCARAGLAQVGVVGGGRHQDGRRRFDGRQPHGRASGGHVRRGRGPRCARTSSLATKEATSCPRRWPTRTSRRARLKAALEELRARQAAEDERAEERSSAFAEAERAATEAGRAPGGRHPGAGRWPGRKPPWRWPAAGRLSTAKRWNDVVQWRAPSHTGPAPMSKTTRGVKRARAALARAKAKVAPVRRARPSSTRPTPTAG